MPKDAFTKGHKKEEKRNNRRARKLITKEKVLGIVPKWALVIIGGGLGILLCVNFYLGFGELDENTMSVTLLRKIWQRSLHYNNNDNNNNAPRRYCPSYGCAITPPEYNSSAVRQALQTIRNKSVPYGTWKLATLTRTSNRKHPPFNQDRATIISPFRPQHNSVTQDFFLGIFDGHGEDGHINAQYFVLDVPKRLAEKLDREFPTPKERLSDDEISTIQQHLKDAFVESDAQAPRKITNRGGCTASVTLRMANCLFFANTGDSYTMLVSVQTSQFQIVEQGPAPGVTMIYTTRADKPHLPEEQARILKMGGRVHIPPQNPMGSRVIVDSKVFNDTIGLAMSRSLGDYEWTVQGVIPDPTVDVIRLDDPLVAPDRIDETTSVFVIAASDGLWDYRLKQWYAKQFAEGYLKGNDPRRQHPLAKMHAMFEFLSPSNPSWYRDDVTAITMEVI